MARRVWRTVAKSHEHRQHSRPLCITSEQREKRYLGHTELVALEAADRLGLSLDERREARLFTNLEPCLMCMGAAMSFFLGKIYYGLESPGDGAASLVHGWERSEGDIPGYMMPSITGGLMREESIHLFKEYLSRQSPGPSVAWGRKPDQAALSERLHLQTAGSFARGRSGRRSPPIPSKQVDGRG